jgi:hypothetical protein
MDRIIEALLRLQLAFEAQGLAEPAVVLGSADDLDKLAAMFGPLRLAADPLVRDVTPTLVGTRLYEPREIKHG